MVERRGGGATSSTEERDEPQLKPAIPRKRGEVSQKRGGQVEGDEYCEPRVRGKAGKV